MTVEESVYNILQQDTELLVLLAHATDSIGDTILLFKGPYPALVIQNARCVPCEWADDKPIAQYTTIAITIITQDGVYQDIASKIYTDLENNDFIFEDESSFFDEDAYYKEISFSKYEILN